MSDRVCYRTGRRTHHGVEICEYTRKGKPEERIAVIAYGISEVASQVICNLLNQATQGKSVFAYTPLPGGY